VQLQILGFNITASFRAASVSLTFQHVETFFELVYDDFVISIVGPGPKSIHLKNVVLMSEEPS
jgi:hypothetical protein